MEALALVAHLLLPQSPSQNVSPAQLQVAFGLDHMNASFAKAIQIQKEQLLFLAVTVNKIFIGTSIQLNVNAISLLALLALHQDASIANHCQTQDPTCLKVLVLVKVGINGTLTLILAIVIRDHLLCLAQTLNA